jgi:chemotaxis response regulator CheB
MPKEAIRLGAAQHVLPLTRIAQAIIDWGRGDIRKTLGIGGADLAGSCG